MKLDSNVNSVSQIFVPNGGDYAYVVGYYGFVQKFNVANPASPSAVGELQFDEMSDGGTSVCQSFDGKALFMADYSALTHNVSRLNLATGASPTIANNALMVGALIGAAGIAFAFANRRRVH